MREEGRIEQEEVLEEIECQKSAKTAFDQIWRKFGKNRKKGRASAFTELLQDLTSHSTELVPFYMTAKEFVGIISEIETHTKGDGGTNQGEPREIVEQWLSGKTDMSRIPLEKIQ